MSFAEGFPDEIKDEVLEAQNYICKLCDNRIVDFHHRLQNTNSNRKLFPVYLNSVFNCVGLCRECHIHRTDAPSIMRATLQEAAMYEHDLTQRGGIK